MEEASATVSFDAPEGGAGIHLLVTSSFRSWFDATLDAESVGFHHGRTETLYELDGARVGHDTPNPVKNGGFSGRVKNQDVTAFEVKDPLVAGLVAVVVAVVAVLCRGRWSSNDEFRRATKAQQIYPTTIVAMIDVFRKTSVRCQVPYHTEGDRSSLASDFTIW